MDWSILFESQMGSGLLVVLEIRLENAAQSRFAQHNHVVKAVTADGTDQALNVSVLPRGLRGRENFVNADPVCRLVEQVSVTSVSIMKQVPRRTVPWEGLHELLRSPVPRQYSKRTEKGAYLTEGNAQRHGSPPGAHT